MKENCPRCLHTRKPIAIPLSLLCIFIFRWLTIPLYGESPSKPLQNSAISSVGMQVPIPCGAVPAIQREVIANDEKEKDAIVDQFRSGSLREEPKSLLHIAENRFKDFTQTECQNYLMESLFLYKTYYDVWRKSPFKKHPINDSTQREYKLWTDRFQKLSDSSEVSSMSVYPRSKDFFPNLAQFKMQIVQEKQRVDQVIRKRNRVMIPSIIALAIGIPLTIAGSIMQSLDGTISTQPYCTIRLDGQEKSIPCIYDFHPPAPGIMIGFGIALTLGGATGLGISLYQANHQFSPATP